MPLPCGLSHVRENWAVTGGGDGTARLWDRTSGQLQTALTGHTGPVWPVAVTPDGRQIITRSASAVVR